MREIKFRAWHTKKKVMFSADEMSRDQMALLPNGYFANISSTDTRLSAVDTDRVMIPLQFTGLTDKNGREIYEGDIVRDNSKVSFLCMKQNKESRTGVITWGEYSVVSDDPFCSGTTTGFHIEGKEVFSQNLNDYMDKENYKEAYNMLEVIGNIYENPEMLK